MAKHSLVASVLIKYPNKVFVETGTYYGDAVREALRCGFDEVHSVEIHKPFYDACTLLFSDESRVHLHLGDSSDCLWGVINNIDTPITFWLDGHIEVGIPHGKNPIPVLEELKAIGNHPIKTHTILIDDRRVMGTDVWFGITEEQVIEGIMKINKDYQISYENSCNAPNDILVARL